MDIIISALIGIGLAMDCFAVSLAIGANLTTSRFKTALIIAGFFGFFQFAMTLAGWFLGTGFSVFISAYDHWIAFLLLAAIGAKMIWESMSGAEEDMAAKSSLTLAAVTVLAVATSIDALAAGISFAVLGFVPVIPAIIIGIISWIFAFCGVISGRQLGKLFGRRAELLGGIILILIGVRILLEHQGWM